MNFRKRIVFISLILALCLLLAACGSSPAEESLPQLHFANHEGNFPEDSTSIALVLEEGETQLLDRLSLLEQADFSGSECIEELYTWAKANPQVKVSYTVTMPDGTVLDNTAKSVDLSKLSGEEVRRWADELGLPVVLHSRDAAQETLEFLRERKALLRHGGLMHCYSYSPEMLTDFMALGLSFSFGGPSTWKNGKKAQECIQRIPAHLLLSETDCPYLTPVPYRGTFPNEPKNVKYVVDNMAALLGKNVEELKDALMQNAKTLFFKLN